VKELLGDGKGGLLTLSVKTILNNPRGLPKDLSHSHYTALTIKNALCDIVRDMRGDRPSVDVDDPDVPLVAILRGMGEGATLSLYRSLHPPGSLHKRGYRQGRAIHKAAMKETLAAGLLLEAGWKDQVNLIMQEAETASSSLLFIDPMAGSGSLVLEACSIAMDIAPGLMRIRCGLEAHRLPPVTRWKSCDDEEVAIVWKKVLIDATNRAKDRIRFMRERPSTVQFKANDIHPGAVDIMQSSLSSAGLLDFVEVSNEDCYDLDVDDTEGTMCFVCVNPPWGKRLTEDITESWEGLRHFVRNTCPNDTQVFVLSGNKAATATLKLKRDKMIPIQTGEQYLRWIQYTIRGKSDPNQSDDMHESAMPLKSKISETMPTVASRNTTNGQSINKNEWL